MKTYFDHESGITFVGLRPVTVITKRFRVGKSKVGKRMTVVASYHCQRLHTDRVGWSLLSRKVFVDEDTFDLVVAALKNRTSKDVLTKILTSTNLRDEL